MFRLSQRADYGLILLSELSRSQVHSRGESKVLARKHSGGVGKFLSVADIAKKNKISPKFLSQVATELKKAGILASKEGTTGGFSLAKPADEIKILDILRVLDGELVEGKCFEDDHECSCGAGDMWGDVKKQLEETIGRKTVADLVV